MNPNGLYDPSLFVSSKSFEMHIKEVKKVFSIVPLETVFTSKINIGKLCTITFDDGWLDNYSIAFPILLKYQLPATIFLTVALVGTNQCFWFENLMSLANSSIENGIEHKFINYFHNLVSSLNPAKLSLNYLLQLISALKVFSGYTLDNLIIRAHIELGISPITKKAIINWNQALEMGQYGITFGSHGLHHWILNKLDNRLKRKEIFESLNLLQNNGIKTIPFFSYPNGNWDKESIDILYESGYSGGLTTQIGYNNLHTYPFLLNRVGIHEYISDCPDLFWFRIFQSIFAGSSYQQTLK